MKRYTHITTLTLAVATGFVLSSCAKRPVDTVTADDSAEISFEAILPQEEATKGVVSGTTLLDDETGYRPLYVTSFLHAQTGVEMDYFTGERFERVGSAWKRTPALYWPVGGSMDFLVYSAGTPFDGGTIRWGAGNTAERMRLYFGSDRTQDDVLFGSAWHGVSSGGAVPIQLSHAQAQIVVTAKLKPESLPLPVTITRVVLTDTYLTGILNVENGYGHPTYDWDFRSAESRDRIVDDPDGIYGTPVTDAEKSVRMLVPEQLMRSLVVYYTVDGVEHSASHELEHASWVAGRKYVYSLVFDPVTRAAGPFPGARIEMEETEL